MDEHTPKCEHIEGWPNSYPVPLHKPTEACVDTCDNPYVCADEWADAEGGTRAPRSTNSKRLSDRSES